MCKQAPVIENRISFAEIVAELSNVKQVALEASNFGPAPWGNLLRAVQTDVHVLNHRRCNEVEMQRFPQLATFWSAAQSSICVRR